MSRLAWFELRQICEFSKLTIDPGNLINMNSTTSSPWSTSWDYDAQHRQWVNSWKNFRTATFYCETMAECKRSSIDSENREPPEPTCSSTRLTTDSIIYSLQSRIKTNDSWSLEHRIVRITRHGTQSAVQGMFIILGHRHRPLHVRVLLAKRNRGE